MESRSLHLTSGLCQSDRQLPQLHQSCANMFGEMSILDKLRQRCLCKQGIMTESVEDFIEAIAREVLERLLDNPKDRD